MTIKIGPINLDNPIVLAPLAGITDLPFRLLAKTAGCALVYSEMISANGLVYGSPKTLRMLGSDPAERPVAFQIFGADPDLMARAAAMVAAAGADIVDLNLGCSVKKVLKTGSGSALMRDHRRAGRIFEAVRRAVAIPVTVKIRSGWDASGNDALKIAQMAEQIGLDALAIHPRTATQGFSGKADWELIARLRQHTGLPVIGNGDIQAPEDARQMMTATGCKAVMIGRAAISSPWLLTQARQACEGQTVEKIPLEKRFSFMKKYLQAAVAYYGETHACRIMRSRLGWFSKGLPHSSAFRESLTSLATRAEAEQYLQDYQDLLARPGQVDFT